jgi:soluble lytic murein transglycosylase-like protein
MKPILFIRRHLCLGAAVLAVVLLAALPLSGSPGTAQAAENEASWSLCRSKARLMEQATRLPDHLLAAIARVESGRWHKGREEILSWPWTVMAEGRGRYLPTKQAAIAEVEKLRARGVRNIDVGCMQINLRYHGDAFRSLDEAFDPLSNVAYAAAFLSDLKSEVRSWSKAIGHYHSRHQNRGMKYRLKVLEAWREERRSASRRQQASYQPYSRY